MLGLISFVGLLGALIFGTLRRPAVALAGILCLYGLKQWGQNSTAFFSQHRTVANLSVGVLVLIAAILRASRGHCLACKLPRSTWLAFGLYVYALLTLAWSPNLDEALRQWGLQWPYIITIVFMAPMIIGNVQDVRIAFNWTAVVGTVICGLALFFGKWGSRGLLVYGDIFESQTNALAIASLGGTVLIIGTLSLQKTQSRLFRLCCLAAIPLGVAVVLRSLSRGQLIAAGVSIMAAWPLAYRVKNVGTFLQFAVGITALAVIGWLAFDMLQIDTNRWSGEQGADDAEDRLNSAMGLLSYAVANPLALIFGLGNSSAFHYVGFYPHIAALEVLAEEGLIGFGLFTAIVVMAVKSIRPLAAAFNSESTRTPRATVAILVAVFIFETLLTFKQGSLLSCTYAFVYAIMLQKLAMGVAHEHLESVDASSDARLGIDANLPRFGNLMR